VRDSEVDNSDACSYRSEASELSALRLDISDIQEAIKNHDLWVQDASAMRSDIDDLQNSLKDHESWMGHLSIALKQIQDRENRFEGEIADIRRRLSIGSDLSTFDKKAQAPLKRTGSKGDISGTMSGGSPDHKRAKAADREDSAVAFQRVELGLTQQLGQGLRMLRTMVGAVEASLARQIDGERSARRAALADLRQELFRTQALPPAALSPPGTGVANSLTDELSKTSLEVNRISVERTALERQAEDRAAEMQNTLIELRTEMAALRAEQQLQAVASGALALASGHLSPHARLRSIKALEERVVSSQNAMAQNTAMARSRHEAQQVHQSAKAKEVPTIETWHSIEDGQKPLEAGHVGPPHFEAPHDSVLRGRPPEPDQLEKPSWTDGVDPGLPPEKGDLDSRPGNRPDKPPDEFLEEPCPEAIS